MSYKLYDYECMSLICTSPVYEIKEVLVKDNENVICGHCGSSMVRLMPAPSVRVSAFQIRRKG